MGPERASSSKIRTSRTTPLHSKTPQKQTWNKNRGHKPQNAEADLPGVQKLKAALRQTRRLLAKENLAADVRVETERRLKSLESDLQTAEVKRKERAMAKRYHKVKFFERTKVLRKIKKVKREIDQGEGSSSKVAATQLENTLFELRSQLNYILNYPKLEKYISLFPPSKDEGEQNPDLEGVVQAPQSEADTRREQLLNNVKHRMMTGEMSGEPELGVEGGVRTSASANRTAKLQSSGQRKTGRSGAPTTMTGEKGPVEISAARKTSSHERMEDDDFFDASDSASDSDSTDEEN